MKSLVYISSAINLLSQKELEALLEKARAKNQRLNITGLLLYKDGSFMQLLEGEDQVVENLFETIKSDTRHRGVICLWRSSISNREFPDWKMGFYNLDDPEAKQPEGFSEFMNVPFNVEHFEQNPSAAQRLLGVFHRMNHGTM